MNDPTPEHAGWFNDVRLILNIVQVTIGLPLPVISATRAAFYFIAIPHADDARKSVTQAQEILADALGLTFAPGTDAAGYATLEAALPSGLVVAITARSQHMPGYAEARIAERLAAIKTMTAKANAVIMTGSAV